MWLCYDEEDDRFVMTTVGETEAKALQELNNGSDNLFVHNGDATEIDHIGDGMYIATGYYNER